ncbi:hypothetical protein ACT16_23105 [Mycobacterium heckeshornense]|nr:hypothetical protein ACT16_23105 [Mycobacterium heckeshornense]
MWTDILRHDVQMDGATAKAAAQRGLDKIPVCWCHERQPIGSACPERAGATPVVVSDVIQWGELDGREMVEVSRFGKPLDVGLPTGCSHRHIQVVEGSSTADQCFPPRLVAVHHPGGVEIEA